MVLRKAAAMVNRVAVTVSLAVDALAGATVLHKVAATVSKAVISNNVLRAVATALRVPVVDALQVAVLAAPVVVVPVEDPVVLLVAPRKNCWSPKSS